MHWLSHFFGLDNESGSFYAFWSGVGSDIGELAIVGALWASVRKHQCHVNRCWRIGRFAVDGTSWVVCSRHHPDHAPTHEQIVRAVTRR